MKQLISLATILALSACGGGGGDTVATQSAEGFWTGTTAKGTSVSLAILENGETWGLYGNANSVVGALHGNTSVSGTSLSGSGGGFNFDSRTVSNGAYTGSVTSKSNISFSVSDGTQFTGAYDASYEQPVTLSNFAGTYTGWAVTALIAPQATTVVIDANGSISSSIVSGNQSCTTSGTAVARASGKNVVNLQLTFTGSYCALGNGATVTGVATYNSATRQIIAMGLNSAKTDGLFFVGTR